MPEPRSVTTGERQARGCCAPRLRIRALRKLPPYWGPSSRPPPLHAPIPVVGPTVVVGVVVAAVVLRDGALGSCRRAGPAAGVRGRCSRRGCGVGIGAVGRGGATGGQAQGKGDRRQSQQGPDLQAGSLGTLELRHQCHSWTSFRILPWDYVRGSRSVQRISDLPRPLVRGITRLSCPKFRLAERVRTPEP